MIGPHIGPWLPALGGAAGGAIASPSPLLLIVAGQSNAGKQGTTGETPPGKYADLGDFYLWDDVSAFDPYAVAANAGDYPTSWGTEAEFVHQLRQAGDSRPVYMVKRALGGTPVNEEAGADWSPASSGELFDELKTRVLAARAGIVALQAAAPEEILLWNQGERDIQSNSRTAAFAANFTAFLAACRAEISTGLFILERTRPFPGWYSNSFTVRKAQLDAVVADGNARAIDGDFEPADFATLHPPPSWCEGIGQRAHAAWKNTYSGTYGAILDAVPDAVSFLNLTEQTVGSTVTSEVITPTGYERDLAISVSGGEYRILNPDDAEAQGWGTGAGRISKWQKLQLRLTASAAYATETILTLTLGETAIGWSVTTAASGAGDAMLSYLIVGGGGSGGRSSIASGAGGGGGGGRVMSGTTEVSVGGYSVTVGTGGASASGGVTPENGGSSSAFGQVAAGGGQGGANASPGADGGNGGGGGSSTGAEGIQPGGVGDQFNGGAGYSGGATGRAGGGGGGAGAPGADAASEVAGAGGEGVSSAIGGVAEVYGSGGGGGVSGATGAGAGGTNAGLGGSSGSRAGSPGLDGTGAGGGGNSNSNGLAGVGASGVVILAYPTGSLTATGGTVTSSGGMTIHRFTATGTFTVTAIG